MTSELGQGHALFHPIEVCLGILSDTRRCCAGSNELRRRHAELAEHDRELAALVVEPGANPQVARAFDILACALGEIERSIELPELKRPERCGDAAARGFAHKTPVFGA